MIKKLLTLFAFVAIYQLCQAQIEKLEMGKNYFLFQNDSLMQQAGRVSIISDVRTRKLLDKYITDNKLHPDIQGWRVQIYWGSAKGTARNEAEETKKKFKLKFPEIPVYMDYQAPVFMVRVGDFRTKSEALKFKNQLLGIFDNSYPVSTKIELPKLD